MSLKPGDKAPELTLFSSEKQPVQVGAQNSKNTVLLFFPAAFTSVCTAELCDVRDNMKKFESLNADVYGISVDLPFTLAKFKEEQGLNFPLLSDFNKEAVKAYDSMYESFTPMGFHGVAKRSAFVLDKEGTVRYAEVLEDAGKQPDMNAIRETLSGLN